MTEENSTGCSDKGASRALGSIAVCRLSTIERNVIDKLLLWCMSSVRSIHGQFHCRYRQLWN